MANIRSAYAEAMNYALEYNGYPIAKNPSYYTDGKNRIYVDDSGLCICSGDTRHDQEP